MLKQTTLAIALVPTAALANWQADLEYGQGDGLGMILFFYAFLVYVIVKDGFKQSRAKGWGCLGACLFVGWLIITFKWALALASLVFLASFLAFCWEKLK